jgi:cbb3-type cytochrome oxidase subunit 3
MSFFELFVATALLRICGVRAWMSHLGFLAVAIDLLGGFFVVADVMEWVTVALAFAFIGVVAQALRRHSRREQIPAGRGF